MCLSGISFEGFHRAISDRRVQEKKAAATPVGKILSPPISGQSRTNHTDVPFNLTKIRSDLARKTHEAAHKVLGSPKIAKTTDESKKTLEQSINEEAKILLQATTSSNPEQMSFARKFFPVMEKIYCLLKKPQSEFTIDDAQALRKHVNNALNLIEANEKQSNGYVGLTEFLRALSYQIRTQVEGMSTLQEMGKHALENWCEEEPKEPTTHVPATKLANDLEKAFKRMPAKHWEGGFWNWLWWAMTNPVEAFTALLDNRIPGCHTYYNSYDQGNVDITYGHFEVAGKQIQAHIGAGPMNEPAIAKAQMEYGGLLGQLQVNQTLESNKDKRGEVQRSKGLEQLIENLKQFLKEISGELFTDDHSNSINDSIFFMATPHDGKIEKGNEEFSNIKTVQEFHTKLTRLALEKQRKIPENIKSYTGYVLPEQLLSKQDIDLAIAFSEKALTAVLGNDNLNPESFEKYNQRLCSAMLTCFNAFLEIKMLINLGNMLNKRNIDKATYLLVCKQCFDRGPLANAVLRAFVKYIENGQLNREDEEQILGLMTGRTMMGGGDRKMVHNRRDSFIDLFRIIGQNEAGFAKVLQDFAGGKDAIKFVPSNQPTAPNPMVVASGSSTSSTSSSRGDTPTTTPLGTSEENHS